MQDIVKKILSENNILKPAYYDYLDTITHGDIELARLGSRLSSLSSSITNAIMDNTLDPSVLISILSSIEEYAVQLEDEEDKSDLEIMFFEGMLNVLSHIQESDPNYRYVGLFKDNLGPASEELCEHNNAFWREVIKQKNQKYS